MALSGSGGDMDRFFPAGRLPMPCSTRQIWTALFVASRGERNPPEWVGQLTGKEPSPDASDLVSRA